MHLRRRGVEGAWEGVARTSGLGSEPNPARPLGHVIVKCVLGRGVGEAVATSSGSVTEEAGGVDSRHCRFMLLGQRFVSRPSEQPALLKAQSGQALDRPSEQPARLEALSGQVGSRLGWRLSPAKWAAGSAEGSEQANGQLALLKAQNRPSGQPTRLESLSGQPALLKALDRPSGQPALLKAQNRPTGSAEGSGPAKWAAGSAEGSVRPSGQPALLKALDRPSEQPALLKALDQPSRQSV
ncbi:circumsporozoite protein-like [Bacillus rossius redtenbacheri]|uniref:circumsporozoite protein-like n=1 Tax=Bacillus rossius redtenbacheri TaxID=93214 RepID=UPI002FDCA487